MSGPRSKGSGAAPGPAPVPRETAIRPGGQQRMPVPAGTVIRPGGWWTPMSPEGRGPGGGPSRGPESVGDAPPTGDPRGPLAPQRPDHGSADATAKAHEGAQGLTGLEPPAATTGAEDAAGADADGRAPRAPRRRTGELAVYFVYDVGLVGTGDPAPVLEAVLGAGVRAVQFRAKAVPDGLAYRLARAVRRLTAHHGALLVINDRLDLALAVDADGVHVGQDDLPADVVRRLWPDGLLGVSVRTPAEARAAEAAGADYVGAGALRSTATKDDARVIGLQGLERVAAATRLPVVAIGGITVADLPVLRRAGMAGVAVASAIARAPDPGRAAAAFVRAWQRASG